jgi:hypothetical protein
MGPRTRTRIPALAAALAILAGCAGDQPTGTAGPSESVMRQRENAEIQRGNVEMYDDSERDTIWDLFGGRDDPNRTVEVNTYLWTAAQEVLDFLPLETADPFSGVLSYGYGTPPGGGPAYRATVYVQDPALDARSLNVALATSSGPVTPATARAVEDAILTRARQLRVADGAL